uniref:E3 ubiquitin/ISG15 ligase TRIM25-like n=1 Tax=Leptobrachium leishanense TaxID=445787 RepID=A0A8C5Q3J6_9ANUR
MASAALRDEVTCCICADIFTDPVTLPCGHSYCRLCITKTWDNQEERESSCPECKCRFRVRPELKRNLRLSNIAESFRSSHAELKSGIPCTYCDSPVPAAKTCLHCEASLCDKHLRVHSKSAEHVLTEPTTSLENWKCSVHREILKYCCCEDAAWICMSCRLDGEHRGHQVETLNEVSEKKKEKLRHILQKLTSQREEAKKRVQSLEELRRQEQEKATGETERVTALIREIRKQLEALEKRVLSEIFKKEEQVSLRVSDLIQQLEIKKEELSRKMGDIEKLCDMEDPVTVLQETESDRDDYCDAEEDTKTHDITFHDVGDLDMGLISETLHSRLAGFVTGVKRPRRVLEASNMSLGVNTALDILLDVNMALDSIPNVKIATDTSPGVNTASDTSPGVNTATDTSPGVNTATDTSPGVNTASGTLLGVNTATDTSPGVNTASGASLGINTASGASPGVNIAVNNGYVSDDLQTDSDERDDEEINDDEDGMEEEDDYGEGVDSYFEEDDEDIENYEDDEDAFDSEDYGVTSN